MVIQIYTGHDCFMALFDTSFKNINLTKLCIDKSKIFIFLGYFEIEDIQEIGIYR